MTVIVDMHITLDETRVMRVEREVRGEERLLHDEFSRSIFLIGGDQRSQEGCSGLS
jgi:hypothetical protein